MSRPITLTDEQRKENKRKIQQRNFPVSFNGFLRSKFDKFSKKYKSRNECVIDLIRTHPEFKAFVFKLDD
jgi:metal-responsive CopG/Arc/MetJ family transcriptional regulator